MLVKSQSFYLLLIILAIGFSTAYAGHAVAQAEGQVRVITLSDSGYERSYALAFSSDGKYIAVGGLSGIYLFNFQQLSLIEFIKTDTWARSLAFLPGTNTLVVGLFDNTVKLWEVPGSHMLRSLEGHKNWVRSVSASGDGSLIVSASDDNTLRVWDIQADIPLLVIDKGTTGIRAVALSPDGSLVAGALGDNTVSVWKVADGSLLYTLVGHSDWVRCLTFSADGQLLASGAFDKTILLWNMVDGSQLKTMQGHGSSVLSLAFSPDGNLLASASVDDTVRLWNVRDGSSAHILYGHDDFVYAVAFSPDGKTLASGGGDNTVRLWNLEILTNAKSRIGEAEHTTPSDCRACHHRRGTIEPPRVFELSCEGCHAGGISLAWCAGFPRAGSVEYTPTAYNDVHVVSGVPKPDREVAVVITSPGNGETLYVQGDYQAPVTVSGKVFYADRESLTKVKVILEFVSAEQATTSLVTYPLGNGDFSFNVAINHTSPPIFATDIFCRVCHGVVSSGSGIPRGDVRIIVSAIAPDGKQASDERWLRVDSSGVVAIPVQVKDDITGEPISGISIQATTLLYEWRARSIGAATNAVGFTNFELESLSQASTTYTIGIPNQVVNEKYYSSADTAQITLKPGEVNYPTITLTAHAQIGSLTGHLIGKDLPNGLEGITISAFQLPGGPVYQVPLTENFSYVFDRLPIDQYLVFVDPFSLAQAELSADSEILDLVQSSQATSSVSIMKGHSISGKVLAQDSSRLPFAWAKLGENIQAIPVNSFNSKYLVPSLPSNATFLTVYAPGYYSLAQPIDPKENAHEFRLVRRPETQQISWGPGEVIIPPETSAAINDMDITLESGWLWGKGGTSNPLLVHLSDMDVSITKGEFALERPMDGRVGWLYVYEGEGQVVYQTNGPPNKLVSGEMIALVAGAKPFPMDAAVVAGLHPTLNQLPVHEIVEPSFKARFENILVRAGIRSVQIITFITYILITAALFVFPILALFWRRKLASNMAVFNEDD